MSPLLAADGALLVDTSTQLERWVDRYISIYSQPAHVSCSALSSLQQLPVLQELDNPFTMEDVKLATRGLKNKKSPGQDGIPPKFLKNGGKPLLTVLFRIFTICWNRRRLPDDFRDTNIITLYTNMGDRRNCNNYSGISLLCIAGKVFARLLLPRVRQIADRILPESQRGFRPSRGTSDMVFSLRHLQEKSVEQSLPLYVVITDLSKAFYTVSRSGWYNILKLLGCPETLLSILVAFHENMKA